MLKILFVRCLFCFCIMANSVQAQDFGWYQKLKSVELLKSNRDDVIKLFGFPERDSSKYFPTYDVEIGNFNIEYSRGLCTKNNSGWNVSEFTVTRIFFDFRDPVEPKNLPFDLRGFKKAKILDSKNAYSFESDHKGISFVLTSRGKVESVLFYPSSILNNFRCK